ncbi:hypothetical protein [Kitasatospora sp. NPDC001547]|uniref:hypothetical protein n=1 Tax=Kitasatospora sp. NPDC001547 TaxID=3364015 RepID=UPI0036C28661
MPATTSSDGIRRGLGGVPRRTLGCASALERRYACPEAAAANLWAERLLNGYKRVKQENARPAR